VFVSITFLVPECDPAVRVMCVLVWIEAVSLNRNITSKSSGSQSGLVEDSIVRTSDAVVWREVNSVSQYCSRLDCRLVCGRAGLARKHSGLIQAPCALRCFLVASFHLQWAPMLLECRGTPTERPRTYSIAGALLLVKEGT
jgi:hypothetical protein